MEKRLAVMDLGTNTFHLLITDEKGNEIFHREDAVKLGEGGINKGNIEPAAFRRGLEVMKQYQEDISKYNVQEIKAIATSALRNAANGRDFVSQVSAGAGINIEIIDGNIEAEYIYKGVNAAGCLSAKNSLVLDIGGGSVEFVICNEDKILWKQSVEVGAARLMDKFQGEDPITINSINALNEYLTEHLQDFLNASSKLKVDNIIGTSGSFESYAELAECANGKSFDPKKNRNYYFKETDIKKVLDNIISSSHQQREAMQVIIPVRIDMIVSAALVTRFVMKKLNTKEVIMTTNSLKEGVLADMVDSNL